MTAKPCTHTDRQATAMGRCKRCGKWVCLDEINGRTVSWRCLLGRAQVKACTSDGGFCYTGDCPHGQYIQDGETTAHWKARTNREWLARQGASV
jgi:hypothetical protein